MAFNFPNSPTNGALYTPPGGYQYVYLDGVWRIVESPQSVVTAEARNRVVNPCFQISQENGNSAVGNGAYPVDQWVYSSTIAGAGQRTGGATPNGSLYTVRMNQPTAKPSLAAGDFVGLGQPIEGIRVADFQWGTASAKQAVLRFTFWSSKAGTFSIAIVGSSSGLRSYVDTFTISAGEANSYQVRTFVIPGDTSGTWLKDNQTGMYLWISAVLGSSYTTATKGWQAGEKYGHTSTTNNLATAGDFYLGDVGLYLDPLATGVAPPWQMPDEAEELAACRRYYTSPDLTCIIQSGYLVPGNYQNVTFEYQANMRTVPSITIGGIASTNVPAAPAVSYSNTGGFMAAITSVSAGFTYYIFGYQANARM